MKRFLSILLFLFPLTLSAQKWEPIHRQFDSIVDLCEKSRNRYTIPPVVDTWIRDMYSIAHKRKDNRLMVRALYWDALFKTYIDRHDLASKLVKRAFKLVDSVKYPYDYHRLIWADCISTHDRDIIRLFRTAKKELKYYTDIRDSLMMGVMHFGISRGYENFGHFDRAIEEVKKNQEIWEKSGYGDAAKYHDMSLMTLYSHKGDEAMSVKCYRRLLESPITANDTDFIVGIYNNAYVQGIDSMAIFKAYELSEGMKGDYDYYNVRLNLGHYYLTHGDTRKAIELYRLGLEFDREYSWNYIGVHRTALGGLDSCYRHLGNIDSAYYFLHAYDLFMDTVNSHNRLETFQQLYEQEALEREEERVSYERHKAATMVWSVVGVALACILGAGWWFYSRRRIHEAEKRELRAKTEMEEMGRKMAQEKVGSQERELATSSLLLIEKRSIIDHLNDRIKAGGDEGKIDSATRRDLLNFIRTHRRTDESLQNFFDYFNKVHPDFFTTLKLRHGELTKGDLRLCAYLRMGLDSKQIAQILSLQPDTVKKARQRLRRKLALDPSKPLEEYLMFIGQNTTLAEVPSE